MAILHSVNEEHEITFYSHIGEISDSELLASHKQVREHEKWKPGFNAIMDLRDADMDGVTTDGLWSLSLMTERYTTGKCKAFKTAIIAPDATSSALAHFYQVISCESPEKVNIFQGLDTALKWVGIDNNAFSEIQHEVAQA